MNLHLFHRARTCDELGICQRTGPHCKRRCQQIKDEAQPPLGYEAARTCVVYQFPDVTGIPAQPATQREDDDSDLLIKAAIVGTSIISALGLLAMAGLVWGYWGEDIARIFWVAAALYG